jgi:uncharacterized protein YbjT (DUF2867 family)
MKVILFGATGMVGQGVLREIVHENFLDFSAIESELAGFDACFFCPGVSSVGMSADRYRTTEQVGRAVIKVARDGYPKPVLESEDIAAV